MKLIKDQIIRRMGEGWRLFNCNVGSYVVSPQGEHWSVNWRSFRSLIRSKAVKRITDDDTLREYVLRSKP